MSEHGRVGSQDCICKRITIILFRAWNIKRQKHQSTTWLCPIMSCRRCFALIRLRTPRNDKIMGKKTNDQVKQVKQRENIKRRRKLSEYALQHPLQIIRQWVVIVIPLTSPLIETRGKLNSSIRCIRARRLVPVVSLSLPARLS